MPRRQKVKTIRLNVRCVIAIIDPDDSGRWVIASGRAEIVKEGGHELIKALGVKYEGDSTATPEPRIVIRLRPDKIRTRGLVTRFSVGQR